MQYGNFHLYFPDSILSNQNNRDLVSSTYQLLLENLKKNGYENSVKLLDTEFKDWQSKTNWMLVISKFWWWYGYKKWLILIWTFVFIILFSLLNHLYFDKLQSVYPVENLKRNYIPDTSRKFIVNFKKFIFTFFYTSFIFFKLSFETKNINFTSLRFVIILAIEYSIGLVCTGFLINWILKG